MAPRQVWTLTAVSMGTFLLLLNVTMPAVSLRAIGDDLGGDFADSQWVINAYALTLASVLLTAGAVADRFGRKKVFVVGLAFFTLTSVLCGLATSPLFLSLARAAQGAGAATLFATSLSLIASEFPGPERGKALGVWASTVAATIAVGPLLGGALTEVLGWRWIFFANAPLGIVAILVAARHVTESRDPAARWVDVLGFLTLGGTLLLLLYALARGNLAGWGSPLVISLLAGSAALFGAFLLAEHRQRQPMLDLGLFAKPSFSGAALAAFTMHASIIASTIYITLYLLNVLDYSPLETGLVLLPFAVASLAAAPLAGRLSNRLPARVLLSGGLLLVSVGLLLMTGTEADSSWTVLLAGSIVAGAGLGFVNPPLARTALAVVPPQQSGMASGASNTFRQIGVAAGVAGLGAILQARVTSGVTEAMAATPLRSRAGALGDMVATGQTEQAIASVPPALRETLGFAARDAFAGGLAEVFVIAAGVALVGAVLVLVLVRSRDLAAAPGPPAEAAVGAEAPA